MATNSERVLKYYYKHRKEEQLKRWNDILDKVYLDIDAGKMRDEIADDLTKSGFRLLREDVRATERKRNNE